MKLSITDICPYGTLEWVEPKTERLSSEYLKGTYPRIYCNLRGEKCPFKDHKQCDLFLKHEKE